MSGNSTAGFRDMVARTTPEDATVLVVSRGDPELLELDGRAGWHFPQRADGVYAGYYPPDSAAAIAHLEALRERGAEFLAFPAGAVWWLEHYADLARHLESEYELVVHDSATAAIYALVEGRGLASGLGTNGAAADQASSRRQPGAPGSKGGPLDDVHTLFVRAYYAEQAGIEFSSDDEALAHYLNTGHRKGLAPYPLFDARWYVERHPEAAEDGANPLLHFLDHSVEGGHDPSPYFDTEFYYQQRPDLRQSQINALVHYVATPPGDQSANPNPLFADAYYLQTYRDAESAPLTPLEHFMRLETSEGRFISHVHRNIFDRLRKSSLNALTRGNWKRGAVLLFTRGGAEARATDLSELTTAFAADHRLDSVVVTMRRTPGTVIEANAKVLVLEDYELACDIFRPSALRMLARTMWRLKPVFALSEVPEVLSTLRAGGIGAYELPSAQSAPSARTLLKRAVRDFGIDPAIAAPERAREKHALTKVLMLCSDWTVSGVNAALEAVGRELIGRGWDVEILFTRDEEFALESAKDGTHLPELPYRFLERSRSGVDGLWEALIADLQRNSPCIVFMAYDQVANCVVPAVTDDIGVVSWVQADDGDYYEQLYRLGRYCNAIVCVSSHIRDTAVYLNPAIGEHAHVIHNTSVSASDVAKRRPSPPDMRLVYAGRLVQYQKRILDFVELADALARAGEPFEILLIGEFVAREGTQPVFERRGREHLEAGRIRLLGRRPRDGVVNALRRSTFFVLLSDFEGLPLSLVEAMASGCLPIVADSPSGIPELVTSGHDGVVVHGRDYDAWAQMLVELLNDPGRLTAMSRNARATVRDGFTIERIGGQFDALLRQIAGEVSAGRYRRPPALHWGARRSNSGDVLPPPNLFVPETFARYPGLS